MPELNTVLVIITKIMNQVVTFEKFQDFLKNCSLKNFRKAEDIVEIITDLNDPGTNFDTKHMPGDLTKKQKESKIKMNMWEMRVK